MPVIPSAPVLLPTVLPNDSPLPDGPGGFLRKAGLALAGVVALVLGVVFSAVFFAAAIAIGVVAWGYLAWTTRALRRDLRARSETPVDGAVPGEPARGRVYEGEGVAVRDEPR